MKCSTLSRPTAKEFIVVVIGGGGHNEEMAVWDVLRGNTAQDADEDCSERPMTRKSVM